MLSAISSVEELTVVEPVITAEQVPTEHSSLDVGSSVEKQSPVAERHEANKKSPIEKQRSVKNGRPPIEPHKLEKQQNFDEQEVKVKRKGLETHRRSSRKVKPVEKPKPFRKQAVPEESSTVGVTQKVVEEEVIEPHLSESGNSRN